MTPTRDAGGTPRQGAGRELFDTRAGFVLAAAGSAVGLGNMWRFPYQTAEGGGAAFVALYLAMTFLLGVPLMIAELIAGRRTRSSPIGALRAIAGRRLMPLGVLFVITPLLILSYFSVIAGWTLRYALDALSGFSEQPAARYAEIATGTPTIFYHLALMAATVAIVATGVRKGIERMALVLMPTLFLLLACLAAWASTLAGSRAGYAFYLKPSVASLLDPIVMQQAASQAFLSLSVGMGIMITYGSYLKRRENVGAQAVVVCLSDFSVAFIGGLVVFPVIFALGLSDEITASTMGALFISIPGAFLEMGTVGQVVGFAFFAALAVAGLTSSVSLLEVATASLIDELDLGRKPATLGAGVVAAAMGLPPALSQNALGIVDQVAGNLLVVTGALGMTLVVGWAMQQPVAELQEGASPFFRRTAAGAIFALRYLVPPVTAWILWLSLRQTAAVIF